jgi:peptide/nickel transport system substrate-binding protein
MPTSDKPDELSGSRIRMISRRAALSMLGAGGALAVLSACSPVAPVSPANPTSGSAAPAPAPTAQAQSGQPRRGGTLRTGILGDPVTLDPFVTGIFGETLTPMFEQLIQYDDKLTPLPMLAESWEMNKEQTQITLHLRRGVQFHSGREFTSDDLKWNIERGRQPQFTAFLSMTRQLTGIETPDKYTLIATANGPWLQVWDMLALMPIIDSVSAQSANPATTPVGTGPFKYVEWVQGDHMSFARHPQYWRTGFPYVDNLTLQIFKDQQAMSVSLESGAIDAADGPSINDIVRLKNDPHFQVLVNQLSGSRAEFALNTAQPPLDNKLFRQAMQYALDRQRIVDTVYKGLSEAVDLPFAPSSPAYDAADDHFYTFDLEKARSLVASSGVTNPSFDFNYSSASAEAATTAQIYQSDLAKIGVNLNLKPLDPVTNNTSIRNVSYSGMISLATLFGQLHPTMEDGNPLYSAVGTNWSNFHSDAYSALMQRLDTETDPAQQKAVYASIRKMILDESWAITAARTVPAVMMSSRVHGLRYAVEERLVFTESWLDA